MSKGRSKGRSKGKSKGHKRAQGKAKEEGAKVQGRDRLRGRRFERAKLRKGAGKELGMEKRK